MKVIHVNFSDHSYVRTEIDLPDIPRQGKGYWKLNTSLLGVDIIKDRFKVEWDRLKLAINRYSNINEWWDLYARKQFKIFFQKEGKKEMERKYGLIKYLEFYLDNLYNTQNLTLNLD